ncbi:MAG: hypothetical protein WCL20_08680 [Actinomycetes bacterium]
MANHPHLPEVGAVGNSPDPDDGFGASGCFRSQGVVNYMGVPMPALAYFERFAN